MFDQIDLLEMLLTRMQVLLINLFLSSYIFDIVSKIEFDFYRMCIIVYTFYFSYFNCPHIHPQTHNMNKGSTYV